MNAKNGLFLFKTIMTFVFLVGAIYYFSSVDFYKIVEVLSKSNYFLIPAAVGILLFNLFLKSLRLKVLSSSKLSLNSFFMIQTISIFLASLTPGRIGEFAKIYLLKKQGMSIKKSVFVFIFERTSDILILLCFGLIFYFWAIIKNKLIALLALLIFVFMVCFCFLVLTKKIRVNIPLTERILGKMRADTFKEKNLCLSFMLTVLIWICEGFFLFLALMALNTYLPFFAAVGIIGLTAMSSILTILPLGIGPWDLTMGFLLGNFNVPNETIVVLLVLIRVITIASLSVSGIIMANLFNIKLIDVVKNAKRLKKW